jgi:hypothetical protein
LTKFAKESAALWSTTFKISVTFALISDERITLFVFDFSAQASTKLATLSASSGLIPALAIELRILLLSQSCRLLSFF